MNNENIDKPIYARFKKSYETAINNIERYRTNTDFEDIMLLTNYILDTYSTTYSFFPDGWHGSFNSAEQFDSFLNEVYHSLYDDGDICFAIVNGVPLIFFQDKFQEKEAYIKPFELMMYKRRGKGIDDIEIKFLSGVREFIKQHEQYAIKDFKYRVLTDAKRCDKEFIIEVYGDSIYFDKAWLEEVE